MNDRTNLQPFVDFLDEAIRDGRIADEAKLLIYNGEVRSMIEERLKRTKPLPFPPKIIRESTPGGFDI
jgi:hypothetical protein